MVNYGQSSEELTINHINEQFFTNNIGGQKKQRGALKF